MAGGGETERAGRWFSTEEGTSCLRVSHELTAYLRKEGELQRRRAPLDCPEALGDQEHEERQERGRDGDETCSRKERGQLKKGGAREQEKAPFFLKMLASAYPRAQSSQRAPC